MSANRVVAFIGRASSAASQVSRGPPDLPNLAARSSQSSRRWPSKGTWVEPEIPERSALTVVAPMIPAGSSPGASRPFVGRKLFSSGCAVCARNAVSPPVDNARTAVDRAGAGGIGLLRDCCCDNPTSYAGERCANLDERCKPVPRGAAGADLSFRTRCSGRDSRCGIRRGCAGRRDREPPRYPPGRSPSRARAAVAGRGSRGWP